MNKKAKTETRRRRDTSNNPVQGGSRSSRGKRVRDANQSAVGAQLY